MAELMAGVRLGDGSCALGQGVAGENRGTFCPFESPPVESQCCRQRPVEATSRGSVPDLVQHAQRRAAAAPYRCARDASLPFLS